MTSSQISEAILSKIAMDNHLIEEQIVEEKATAVLQRRKQLAVKAMESIASLQETFNNMQPEEVSDEEGKTVWKGYNKHATAERKQTKSRIAKLEEALAKALNNAEWKDLEELVK